MNIYVNNKRANLDTKVYDNFAVIWTMEELSLSDVEKDQELENAEAESDSIAESFADLPEDEAASAEDEESAPDAEAEETKEAEEASKSPADGIDVLVNDKIVHLRGKDSFIYVDVFDYIDFDLSKPQGKSVATLLNGKPAQYTEQLKTGDKLDIYWEP